MDVTAPSSAEPLAAGAPATGSGVVRAISQFLAILAAGAGLIYALGGLVLWLRLWIAGRPQLAVVSGLPREVVISVGLAIGFLSLLCGVAYAGWRLVVRVGDERPPRFEEPESIMATVARNRRWILLFGTVLAVPTWGVVGVTGLTNDRWADRVWTPRWWLVLILATAVWIGGVLWAWLTLRVWRKVGENYWREGAKEVAPLDERKRLADLASGAATDHADRLRTTAKRLRREADEARTESDRCRKVHDELSDEHRTARRDEDRFRRARDDAVARVRREDRGEDDLVRARQDLRDAEVRATDAQTRMDDGARAAEDAEQRARAAEDRAREAEHRADDGEEGAAAASRQSREVAQLPTAEDTAVRRYNTLPAVGLSALLTAAICAPAFFAASAAVPLVDARVCLAGHAPVDGQLIGGTKDWVYLTDDRANRIVMLPRTQVSRAYAGDDARLAVLGADGCAAR